jgi:hypothetical protein
MRFLRSALLLTLVGAPVFAQAEDVDMSSWPKVLTPGTMIQPGSGVKVVPVDRGAEVHRLTGSSSGRPIETVSGGTYMRVTAIAKPAGLGPGEADDLAAAAAAGDLHVQAAALKASADCKTVDGEQRCRVHKELNLESAHPYEPAAFARAMMDDPNAGALAAGTNLETATMGALDKSLKKVTGQDQRGIGKDDCGPEVAAASSFPNLGSLLSGGFTPGASSPGSSLFSGGGPPSCALSAARNAYLNAQKGGRRVADFMVVTDFSDGGVTGRMWFVGPMGNLINVGVPNPLEVSRGQGGFGAGGGSFKTPNGAIITRPYSPPRGGNIMNGIELDGLEPGNRDIHGRGVLLHGWTPGQPTQGCLGIAGTLQTRSGTNAVLGGANHFDTLANGPFRQGGVVMYNYTPDNKTKCN